MNGEYLYEAMGGISPLHVHEAEAVRFSPSVWRRLLPVAACLAVLIGMYAGFRSLLYGTPGMETVVPAAQAAAEPLAQISLFHWGSLILGLIAWGLPCAALVRRQHQKILTLSSFIACILSLLLLVCGVLDRVNRGEFTALEDTMGKILAAAVVLVVGTAVMNGLIYIKKIKLTSNTVVSMLLLLLLISFLVWLLIPNHFLLLDSAEVQYDAASVSEEQAAALIDLINQAGGKRKAFSEYERFSLLEREFGGTSIHQGHAVFYLTTVYDGAFSFNPFHFGEDATHNVLVKFNADGEPVAIWKMSYPFDELYSDWLDQFR